VTASRRGAIRGLHGEAMTKFVSVAAGSAFGVYLDARPASATFGEVVTVELELGTGVVVSPGICNGFQATAEGITQYAYCFDHEWEPVMDGVRRQRLRPRSGNRMADRDSPRRPLAALGERRQPASAALPRQPALEALPRHQLGANNRVSMRGFPLRRK